MSAEQDNQDKRLEGMLRRWGAQESRIKANDLDLAPPSAPAARPVLRMAYQWGALAAGIILMIGAILVVVLGGSNAQPSRSYVAPAPPTTERSTSDTDRKYAEALAALESAQTALKESKDRFDDLDRQYRAALEHAKELQSAVDKRGEELAAEQRKAKEFSDAVKTAQEKLADFRRQSEADQKALQDKYDGLAKDKTAVDAKLLSAVQELGRARKMTDEATAAAQKATGELAFLKAQQDAVFNDVQRAFLAAAITAGGAKAIPDEADTSIQARQAAARQHKLAERCASARSIARSIDARRLLDKLEAVLTRLDMIDVHNAGALRSFVGLLADGQIVGQIDKVLAGTEEGVTVRAILLEARFVLAGAQRAG
ncbi:MAG: hypothetical protein ACE15C_04900 [Phycisphaerae bacterium]